MTKNKDSSPLGPDAFEGQEFFFPKDLNDAIESKEREQQAKKLHESSGDLTATPTADTSLRPTGSEVAFDKPSENTSQASQSAGSKRHGNKNALRHGAYSDALLPWESEEEFAALHRSFVEDLKPKGACQEETIFAISHWTWKRRRVIRGSQISFYRSPAAKSLANGETTWDDMVRKNIQIPEDHEKWIAELHGFVKDLRLVSDHIKSHFYWTSSTEGKDIQLKLAKMSPM